jgi:hypothetical protein
MSTSDFSPGHRALPRIFANPKESQLAEITQLLFQSGSKAGLIASMPGRLRRECCPLLSSSVEVEVMRDGWRS